MRYLTIEQRERLQHALEQRAAALGEELREDLRANLDAEPEAAALKRDADELEQIGEALKRLHEPSFGLCADCGSEIPYVRLLAQPAAARCVRCEELRELAQAAPQRAAL